MFFLKKIKHILFLIVLASKRWYRKITGKQSIYVFGDSHTQNFQHEMFEVHHIGPATAYKLSSDTSTTQAKKKIAEVLSPLSDNKKHYFLFVFGEIDCRIHINKISKTTHKPLVNVVNSTVAAYIAYLQDIQQQFPKSIIMVFNVLPSGEEKNIYCTRAYPPRQLHQKIVMTFNERLQKECEKHKFVFLSVFDTLVNSAGKRKEQYVFDDVHFNTLIIPFILKEIQQKVGLQ